jgi:short-chain fatty acids transporter
MIWHGGISGSAPIKASEKNHIKELMNGITDNSIINSLPGTIGLNETVFSTANLVAYGFIFLIIPTVFWVINKYVKPADFELEIYDRDLTKKQTDIYLNIDKSKAAAYIFGGFILITLIYVHSDKIKSLEISPNILNLFMLGFGIIMHQNFTSFLSALKNAISGAAGILIQFPLYFGIMGIMKESGLVLLMSDFFISISNQTTLPIYTLISAGIVNILVPSGGGQWAVQGPVIIDAAINLGVPIQKVIMALAYGDQLTNMLQPFWALPLLAITGLKAKDILPFSLIVMVVGGLIFITTLIVF